MEHSNGNVVKKRLFNEVYSNTKPNLLDIDILMGSNDKSTKNNQNKNNFSSSLVSNQNFSMETKPIFWMMLISLWDQILQMKMKNQRKTVNIKILI